MEEMHQETIQDIQEGLWATILFELEGWILSCKMKLTKRLENSIQNQEIHNVQDHLY